MKIQRPAPRPLKTESLLYNISQNCVCFCYLSLVCVCVCVFSGTEHGGTTPVPSTKALGFTFHHLIFYHP